MSVNLLLTSMSTELAKTAKLAEVPCGIGIHGAQGTVLDGVKLGYVSYKFVMNTVGMRPSVKLL